mmetsp:Transcript_24511/g.28906  ORF Transcript_24511/g.28906 Transcript_24511/m.28906 type:complete len:325 (-) Transcript_24511:187-1161(-)
MVKTTYSYVQDTSLIPTIAVTLWIGLNAFNVYLLAYLVIFATKTQGIVIIGLCMASLLLPRKFLGKWGTMVGNFSAAGAAKYFGIQVTFEDEDAVRNCTGAAPIFASEPHDILPYNLFAFNRCLNIIPEEVGQTLKGLVTGAVYKIPFMRQVYSWNETEPVDKKSFRYHLKNRKAVVFVPGGVQEVIMLDPNRPQDLVLYLKSRKGFIKLALENGNPIIPVFCFGLDKSYGYWIPRGNFFNQMSRTIGFVPLVFWGRFGIPFGIPRATRLHNVIGKPIEIPCEGSEVKNESVEKYHALFLTEMEALFERHKEAEGYGDRKLKIS